MAPTAFPLPRFLLAQEALFRQATRQMQSRTQTLSRSEAAEWLPDNFYLIQQTCRQIREDMPARFYRQLPLRSAGPLRGYPRVYALAQKLIVRQKARLDLASMTRFVRLYQDLAGLAMGELWALPVMLRLGLVEFLAQRICLLTGLPRDASLPTLVLPPAEPGEETVSDCITSLRRLATLDWRSFFESLSRVERVLRGDPAQVYARMDRETRDRYRKVVEELARATGRDEPEVARQAIDLARTPAPPATPRTAHVGYYLIDQGRAKLESRLGYRGTWRTRLRRRILDHPTPIYLGGIGSMALVAGLGAILYASPDGLHFWPSLAVGLLGLIPALTVSVGLMNWIISLALPPRVLPKMDFEDDIPAGSKTLVVIPSLLSSSAEVKSLLKQIELHYLRSQGPHLYFALLTDLPDAPLPPPAGREPLAAQASDGITALNRKYPRESSPPFYLFHRDSRWNPQEERWMGWERKRGKLHQLNRLLRGGADTAFSLKTGDLAVLPGIKYVITLDADTLMPREAAHRLVAALAHPLNRAEFAPGGNVVSAGYTLLQPGIEITSTSVDRSRFTRIFAGDVGFDLYSRAASNAYQDLFGEGSYVGKGIYEVDAFERSLAGRMPENALLSHDLIEGLHGRVGLVTDVVLYEDYPPHYFVYLRRSRRWIRGDWQLLPWLLPRVPSVGRGTIPNDLSLIGRWKILDNLRRSLLAPALLALFLAGWLGLPGSPLGWTLAGGLALAVPVFTDFLLGSMRALRGSPWPRVFRALRVGLMRWVLALAFILYETLLTLGGVATTLVRMFVTRKHLLQWTSYADMARATSGGVTVSQVLTAIVSTAAAAGAILGIHPAALAPASPVLLAWLLSPLIAWFIGRPIDHAPAPLSAGDTARLRALARQTWSFFEQFVGPEDHWLPPDHFQEAPLGRLAHSTSPTNVGMLLLSTLTAYDLGYIGLSDLSARLQAAFDSLDRLEKYRGHFLNWYETRTLEPLPPRYVSTVDSGNLIACLRTLKQGCQTLRRQPIGRTRNWDGLLDTLSLFDGPAGEMTEEAGAPLRSKLAGFKLHIRTAPNDAASRAALLHRLFGDGWNGINQTLLTLIAADPGSLSAATLNRLSLAADRTHSHLFSLQREADQLTPWRTAMSRPPAACARPDAPAAIREAWQALAAAWPPAPALEEIEPACAAGLANLERLRSRIGRDPEALAWCENLARNLPSAGSAAAALIRSFEDLDERAGRHIRDMDFRFLFDPQRQLFHIGYNVPAEKLDNNYYDLLASEARIASIVTIARNEVPPSHWLHLGRPLTRIGGARALLSWGGTMFEYLMPALLIRHYEGTFLQRSCLAAVDGQIEYGRRRKVPWGVSESGYYAFDADLNYQYRTFGVPGLGFKRNLAEDLVVAPYASLLALSWRPRKVMENIARLDKMRMRGAYGFYEAVDFSAARLPLGETRAVVRSYMAHHQGMILVALVNHLHDNVMVRRFHADPVVRSVELFLQERVPRDAPLEAVQSEDQRAVRLDPVRRQVEAAPWSVSAHSPAPQVHCLSNGRYGVLITSAGGGFSRWQGLDLTRWRSDTTREDSGSWIYLRDLESGEVWSAADQPTAVPPESQAVQFFPHRAEFRRSDRGLGLTMEIVVAPDDDVEIRRLSLTNHGDRVRHIALTSYGEVILAPQAADARHPAFNNLFIESEYRPDGNMLLFRRRPRAADEEPVFLAHAATVSPGHPVTGAYETDRARFLGRGRTLRAPAALGLRDDLSGTAGATLDPIMALSQILHLPPHASAQVSFLTIAARSRDAALGLAERYQDARTIERAFEQSRGRAEAELRRLDLTAPDLELIQQLLSALLYPRAAWRAGAAALAANRQALSGLWPFSVSGDYPILLVKMNATEDLGLVRLALQAHAFWRRQGFLVDLVILNQQGMTYGQELRGQLQRLLVRHEGEDGFGRRGGVFPLYADQLRDEDRILLETAAGVVLDAGQGSLAQQLQALNKPSTELPAFVPIPGPASLEPTPPLARPADLVFDNGWGGFSPDGREYVIFLEPERWTPAPWINVIANPDFGFTVSEAGSGFTWFGNSSENRLTPWSNDPVADPPGEAIFLRDEETAEVWSPTPLPCRAAAPYLVRHGAGYSIFEHHSHGLAQRLRLFADAAEPVKIVHLRLTNLWARPRRLTATFYAEWVLGSTREAGQAFIVSTYDSEHQALLARNRANPEFGERVAFVAASRPLHGLTADRTEFLGRKGDLRPPAALRRIGLASVVEPGLDPCAALQLHIDLPPGESQEVFFLLGQGKDRADALRLIERFQSEDRIAEAWRQGQALWEERLDAVQVKTPDPAMDLLLNRWLIYQTLACRVWARSAFYQSSGAFGFRDQLQDVMALVHTAPGLEREQILRAAQHQFEAGDVLHWWHPPSGRGVRTRFSDDLLWLPYVVAHYVASTGDAAVLEERIPFRQGAPLEPGETERYGQYAPGVEPFTLYEHCRRALEKAVPTGTHGLPLMGGGDWNDGMNRVGIEGRGESVWLGWFLIATLTRFAGLCDLRGESGPAAAYRRRAEELGRALEANAWDGAWYRRAYYDDGTPLGSAANEDCQIDAMAQSWAVLSGAGDPERATRAMASVTERLVRPDDQLLLLLAPPFDRTPRDPGYIKGYPPGIRENGAQYTHAALWVVWAFAELGQGDRAAALFRMLNPISHSDTPDKAARYAVEPYVVAADVYSAPSRVGRGGWTWYTGSSSLMYRLGLEAILGLRRAGRTLAIEPCIPKAWARYQITYRVGPTTFQIEVENPEGVNRGVRQIELDGEICAGASILLPQDGNRHRIQVKLGGAGR
ncbi:MAG: hypothetical protein NTZ26_06770 [Candidatus Aminicenantes bacterium]|nr:hypothetical protein [Candidatus Aminicenantes bacterium]